MRRTLVKQLSTLPTDPPLPDDPVDVEAWLDETIALTAAAARRLGPGLRRPARRRRAAAAHGDPADHREVLRRPPHRHLVGADPHGHRGPAGPRPSAGVVDVAPAHLGAAGTRRRAVGRGRGAGRAGPSLPRGVRPGHRDRRRVVDRLGQGRHACGAGRGSTWRRRRPAGCWPATPRRSRRRTRWRRCCPRSTRRRWAGRSATGSCPRTARRSTTRSATSARPSGGTGRWWGAGRSARTAPSPPSSSPTAVGACAEAVDAAAAALEPRLEGATVTPSFPTPLEKRLRTA